MEKAAFSKKKVLFRQQTGLKFKEETIKCNIWSIALCGAEKLDTSESRSKILGTF